MRKVQVLIAALLCSSTAWSQSLYKVVSPAGKISYSSEKPEGPIAKTLTYAKLDVGSPQAAQPKVVLYTAAWCGYCTQAKAYMAAKNIRYEEIDVETNYGRSAFARATGLPPIPDDKRASGIPFLVMGDVKQRGFSLDTYERLFAAPPSQPRNMSKSIGTRN